MRRGKIQQSKQLQVDIRLVFPHIQSRTGQFSIFQCPFQSAVITHLAARTVDEERPFFQPLEKTFIGIMKGFIGSFRVQRHMTGDEIRLTADFFRLGESRLPFPARPRGIVQQHTHPQRLGIPRHFGTDIPDPDHAESPSLQLLIAAAGLIQQQRGDILRHGLRIAARRIGPPDPRRITILRIDMVITDRRTGDEFHRRSFQQFRRAFGPGPGQQRIGVQQSFLKALASQMLTLGNIPNLGTLIDILVKNVDTNLTAANLAWFARQFLSCRMDDVSFQTMPIGSSNTINGVSFVSIGIDKWLALVNSSINPYLDEVTRSNVNILTSAGGGSFYSTNGQLAGGPDSFYCLECTVKTGKAVHHAPGMHIAAESEAPSGSDAPAPPDVPGPTDAPAPTDAPTPTEAPPAPTEAPPAETPQVEVVAPPAEGGEG